MSNQKSNQPNDFEEYFRLLDVDSEIKDRLILQYLANRRIKTKLDAEANEIDTDWEN